MSTERDKGEGRRTYWTRWTEWRRRRNEKKEKRRLQRQKEGDVPILLGDQRVKSEWYRQ